jgi:hypothetical protein
MKYRLTLSETESYLRKVARACGLDWGIAEEAGKAARWLAAFGLPGPETAHAHLQNLRGKPYADFAPDCSVEPWQAPGGLLCPIVTGAALADRSAQMLDGQVFRLGPTAYPLLLAAILGQAARFHDTAFAACWGDVQLNCLGHDLQILGRREDLLLPETGQVRCFRVADAIPEIRASTTAYAIDKDVFDRIDALAFETYAPATAASRAGAGAGLTDND